MQAKQVSDDLISLFNSFRKSQDFRRRILFLMLDFTYE